MEVTMKAILVVDESETSTRAVEMVRNRKWPLETTFLVLAVLPRYLLPPPPPAMMTLLRRTGSRMPDRVAHARVGVQLTVEALRSAGLKAHGEVRMGRPRKAILEAAREMSAELIVMGASKVSWLGRLLRGGDTALRVSASAPCQVDVFREMGEAALV
jgi:nucleotide-binding universal stress UspA family protein